MFTNRILWLIPFIVIGGLVRFWNLGANPLWIDEAFFAHLLNMSELKQEFPTVIICQLFSLRTEFELRFLSALAGTLTIPAIYFAAKHNKLEASIFVALFPLFIFWSRMARPYAFAGLFVVLGWRWWYLNIVGIFTTPIALIGSKISKFRKIPIIILTSLTIVILLNRSDVGAWSYGVRMFYIPALVILLYLTELELKYKYSELVFAIICFFCIVHLPSYSYGKWYSKEVQYADWRAAGQLNFVTNAHVSNYYSGGYSIQFGSKSYPWFIDLLNAGDTITMGIDYYALDIKEMPSELKEKYKDRISNGEVIRLQLTKSGFTEF